MSKRGTMNNPQRVRMDPPIGQRVRLTSYKAVALATPTVALKEGWAQIFRCCRSSIEKGARPRDEGGRPNAFDKVMSAMNLSFNAGVPLHDAYAGITWQAQQVGWETTPYGGSIVADDLLESFARTSAEFADVGNALAAAVSAKGPGGREVRLAEGKRIIDEIREHRRWLANLEFAVVTAVEEAA